MKKILNYINRNQAIIFSYSASVVLFMIVSLLRPGYADVTHLKVIAMDCAILGIVSLGQTFVILTGGLDLSIPWIFTSSSYFLSMMCAGSSDNLIISFLAVLLICTFMGMINGAGIAYLGISPVIMTLGSNVIFMGALLGLTGGKPQEKLPSIMQTISKGTIGNIPNLLIIWIIITIIATLLLSKRPFGRSIYAVGNNETVALFSGINVKMVKFSAYAICGFCAGLAGILFSGRLGQLYLGMGDPFQMQTIAAVAIGGASLMGGSGNYIGTVAGAITIIVLTGLLGAFNLQASVQQVIYGVVLFVTVFISSKRATR